MIANFAACKYLALVRSMSPNAQTSSLIWIPARIVPSPRAVVGAGGIVRIVGDRCGWLSTFLDRGRTLAIVGDHHGSLAVVNDRWRSWAIVSEREWSFEPSLAIVGDR